MRFPLLALALLAAAALPLRAQVAPPRASLFPLDSVRLLPGPFQAAQETDRAYLLQLEPDRLLAWFRREAGLLPKGEVYPDWESRGIAGHTLGHYLSALSAMWQATGDERLRTRVDYLVDELAACQDANGDGYVAAIPNGKKIFAEVAAGRVASKDQFDLNGGWVPWYTLHKLFAGLLDASQRAGNPRALGVAVKLADWCGAVVGPLDEAAMQRMLAVEQGGMAESLAELSALTGEPRYLALAKRFRHAAVFDPLARGEDRLTGLHANMQIPKIIGYERIYELTGEEPYGAVARNFWRFVVRDRSFATGGHGTHEGFFDPARFRENALDAVGPETCNTYNMLKLTGQLFARQPDGERMDYCERALYNHILCSQAPGQPGALAYYTSMRPGAFHTFSRPGADFWCCVGTGMENHARYGGLIYAQEGADRLLVNLFIPSELRAGGMTLRQETRFPAEGRSTLTFTALPAPRTFTVAVRCPGWAAPGDFRLSVNGQPAAPAGPAVPGQYAELTREWHAGDALTVELPLRLRTETLPGAADYAAVFCGPVLLAGDLGRGGLEDADFTGQILNTRRELSAKETPVLLAAAAADLPAHLRPVAGEGLAFQLADIVRPQAEVTLRPFYELAKRHYAVYWHLTTPERYAGERRALEATDERARALDARSTNRLTPGEQQPDVDHRVQSEDSRTGLFGERRYRDAWRGGWFSYGLKVSPDRPVSLLCTYWGGEALERRFDLLVDGVKVASQALHNDRPGEFFDVEYSVPAELTRGKDRVTVRFQAAPGGVFELRAVQ